MARQAKPKFAIATGYLVVNGDDLHNAANVVAALQAVAAAGHNLADYEVSDIGYGRIELNSLYDND